MTKDQPRENSYVTTAHPLVTPDGTYTSAPRPTTAGRYTDADHTTTHRRR